MSQVTTLRVYAEEAISIAHILQKYDPAVTIGFNVPVDFGEPNLEGRRYMHPFWETNVIDGLPYIPPEEWCVIRTILSKAHIADMLEAHNILPKHIFEKCAIRQQGVPHLLYGHLLPRQFKQFPYVYGAYGKLCRNGEERFFSFREDGSKFLLYQHRKGFFYRIQDYFDAIELHTYKDGWFLIV